MTDLSLQAQSRRTAIAGLIICILLGIYLRFGQNAEIIDIASLLGSAVSLIALIIALLQIASIRKTSEATKKAVEETQSRIVRNVSVADVSDASRLIEQIQTLLQSEEYRGVWFRLKDLQVALEQLQGIDLSSGEPFLKEVGPPLKTINLELLNLPRVEDEYDPSNLNESLEDISRILNQEKGRLTYE